MSDIRKILTEMRRPAMLMRAARLGMADYNRGRWLKRLAGGETAPERTVPRLLSVEEQLEETRLAGDASYSITQHIEVLIALLAEASLLRRQSLT
ncbi:MAG: hypothetical protein KBF78_08675 [Fuscovulum sp.]|jgi:hypothetical protein|nr:hypothetical protein [Fuscovulum sp.]